MAKAKPSSNLEHAQHGALDAAELPLAGLVFCPMQPQTRTKSELRKAEQEQTHDGDADEPLVREESGEKSVHLRLYGRQGPCAASRPVLRVSRIVITGARSERSALRRAPASTAVDATHRRHERPRRSRRIPAVAAASRAGTASPPLSLDAVRIGFLRCEIQSQWVSRSGACTRLLKYFLRAIKTDVLLAFPHDGFKRAALGHP